MKKTTVSEQKKSILREIPSTEELLQFSKTTVRFNHFPRSIISEVTRSVLETLRQRIKSLDKSQTDKFTLPDKNELISAIEKELHHKMLPRFRRVINATGIILHTGLGRAILPTEVIEVFNNHLKGYSRLEADLNTGKRKSRDIIIEELICKVTRAKAATVVNNNAAATVLILNTIASGKEVICSRGQMVEIGGSFRLPEVIKTSGVSLVEVGTTNRTYLQDYKKAITSNTGALLRVHHSNFRMVGFTASVSIEDLVKLGQKYHLPVIDDIGSGVLTDLSSYGFKDEPVVSKSIKDGADLVCFSADKLMGGPQAGIIVGKKKYIEAIRKNPLSRTFRVSKLVLSALETTLKLFLDKDRVFQTNPTLKMLTTDLPTIETRAKKLGNNLQKSLSSVTIEIMDEYSQSGGGSLGGYDIPTKVVAIQSKKISSQSLADKLRQREVPIFTRVKGNQVLLDPRTILEGEETEILKAFRDVL